MGAVTLEPCASACCCSNAWPTPSVMIPAASATPDTNFRLWLRFIFSPPLSAAPAAIGAAADASLIGTIIGQRTGLVRALESPLSSPPTGGTNRALSGAYWPVAGLFAGFGGAPRGSGLSAARHRARDSQRREAQRLLQAGRQPSPAPD